MFFTILLTLWIVFLGLIFAEMKLIKTEKNDETTKKYAPIRFLIIILSAAFTIVYGINLSGNVNIQNIVMTVLMGVTVILSMFVIPKMIVSPTAVVHKGWLIFRNIIAIFNALTMLVHFIIFVVLA